MTIGEDGDETCLKIESFAFFDNSRFMATEHIKLCNFFLNHAGNIGEWLQVDFLQPLQVLGVVTQGRADSNMWATSYKILYGSTLSNLQTMQKDGEDLVS